MTMFASLAVTDNEPVGAVRDLLTRLLAEHVVSAVLVAVETHDGRSVQPALITDAAGLERANPLLPVLPTSAARMASLVTRSIPASGNGASSAPRIAVVMRPCELRATVELAKLRQVAYERLLTIGIDCLGTFESSDISGPDDAAEYLDRALEAAASASAAPPDGLTYRHACSICTTPVAWRPDIGLHTIGVDAQRELLLEINDETLLESLRLEPGVDASVHQETVQNLIAVRQERRDAVLDAFGERLGPDNDGAPGLLAEFETCQRCLNCTVACPLCYCKECLFRGPVFTYEPDRYLNLAERKGLMRLPGDAIAFQLTRLAHISVSCVGCGLCTSACPADLPVDALFQTVACETQRLFEYVPGRDLEEPLLVASFDVDEFRDLGEREAT